ncbi:rRNA maturation RNase YbeY [Candidatus Azambacteria bacterium RIFCSPLOWO2_01_FULL_37_9]|uniref:rRNA maturation RNase YbeY n=1 Tax=Candidatus Azambacteria bacterium RIFCSPLOWO2_01_FULL_37_9 TaxID=1797297 RepID=A0A1F5C5W3_9BACT|nr:MAG: rRNA maturation RNase YbeY [Candidatus Azambacteria bacterium RIFCSPLOWO2_01_FULL_37_9]
MICLPYAEKQAKKLKLTLKQELAMLLSHGILHILGYDHERSKKEAKIMDELQNIMTEKVK